MATDKFSATVDVDLLAEVKALAGPRGMSSFVATALAHELERVRLRALLDELADELGPPDEELVLDTMVELTRLTRSDVPEQRGQR